MKQCKIISKYHINTPFKSIVDFKLELNRANCDVILLLLNSTKEWESFSWQFT